MVIRIAYAYIVYSRRQRHPATMYMPKKGKRFTEHCGSGRRLDAQKLGWHQE